jgi:hypothetical protein
MTRLLDAWRALERERRLVALAAVGLFLSMFLPWYSKTATVVEKNKALSAESSLNAFQAFSWVEAAVLLISAGVLAMLLARAERRAFELPGGDGFIVMVAGAWAAVLIFYRLLDKPGLQGNEKISATVGVKWGIFIALLVALGLLYAGAHLRTSERTRRQAGPAGEPPSGQAEPAATAGAEPIPSSPGHGTEATTVRPADGDPALARSPATPAGVDRAAEQRRSRYPPAPGEQMSLEDPPAEREQRE